MLKNSSIRKINRINFKKGYHLLKKTYNLLKTTYQIVIEITTTPHSLKSKQIGLICQRNDLFPTFEGLVSFKKSK